MARQGYGIKTIPRELGVSRNTVRKYLRRDSSSLRHRQRQKRPWPEGETAFDTGKMESRKVPESALSNAPMAAHVTGFIRAVLGEILPNIPADRTFISCTTDGIFSDAPEDQIDLSGELAQRFQSFIDRLEA